MKTPLKFVGIAAFAAVALVGCKKGGANGVYSLDKTEMKASANKEIEKMPKEQQEMAKAMVGIIDMLDISIELQDGGKAKMSSKMPNLGGGEAKSETKEGTWKQDGNKVTISATGEKEMTCDLEGDKLSCKDEKNPTAMVFKKG